MILQGQNVLSPTFLEKTKWAVCLGRLRLPILPLTREQARGNAIFLGERAAPTEKQTYYKVETTESRQRRLIIDRTRVALRVSNLSLDFVGQEQWIWGVVESCGIRPNLRSIINEERLDKICFRPRLILEPSRDVPKALVVLKLITFDLCPYEADPT